MPREGPPLETLTRRLAECPPEFLALPRVGETGAIHVDAVVSDLLRELGGAGLSPEALCLCTTHGEEVQEGRAVLRTKSGGRRC